MELQQDGHQSSKLVLSCRVVTRGVSKNRRAARGGGLGRGLGGDRKGERGRNLGRLDGLGALLGAAANTKKLRTTKSCNLQYPGKVPLYLGSR